MIGKDKEYKGGIKSPFLCSISTNRWLVVLFAIFICPIMLFSNLRYNLEDVEITVSSHNVNTGDSFDVIVSTTEVLEDWDVAAYQFMFYFDETIIQYEDYSLAGTISQGGSALVNDNIPGELNIGYMNVYAIFGEGDLIYLTFSALQAGFSELIIEDFVYNAVPINNITNGEVNITGTTVAAPQFDPPAGLYYNNQLVSIECATEEAIIYYTTDGTNPDQNSTVYSDPIEIPVHTEMTIKARAYKEGMQPSPISEAHYNVTGQVSAPNFDPPEGSYENEIEVHISTSTPEAEIYYTLDGTDPEQNDFLYTSPLQISDSVTIKARAYKEDWMESEIAEAEYIIDQISADEHNSNHFLDVLLYPSPYISNSNLSIVFSLSSYTYVTIDVFNVRGQRVVRLAEGFYNGDNHLTWDMRDRRGTRISSGIYLVRLKTEESNLNRRIIVVN